MLVSLSSVTFGYTAELIFQDLSFQVNPKEHIGIVGPNGHGKSTLLRLVAGTLPMEAGERSVRKGTDIGYLRQSQEFPDDVSVHDLLVATFPEIRAVKRKLDAVQKRMEEGDGSESTLEEFGELQHRFEELDGYAMESRADQLASEVGFGPDELSRTAGSLSGGERTRFELARVLLREPTLLMLDEPTNHLDLVQTERLERRLAEYPHAFLLISHDRAFLRATCTTIVEVERKKAIRYQGNYDAYRDQREARLKRALDEYVRQNEKVEKTEEFIRKNIAGQKTKQAQARRKMLEKLERVERPEDVWEAARHLGMQFEMGEHPGGKEALKAEQLSVGHDGAEPLVQGFEWTLHRGDRVGVVGPNGAGKTTLIRTLLGKHRPTSGRADVGYRVSIGFLDQKLRGDLEEGRSLVDEVRSIRPDLTIEGARDALARYRFLGEDVFKAVGSLSGGERCRLSLLKVSLLPHNLLVLDEPTNHLDIPAREVLERALQAYDGSILVISHDRQFLDEVVQKILWVEGGEVRVYEGNYSWAKSKRSGNDEVRAAAPSPPKRSAVAPEPSSGKQSREDSKRRRRERQKHENRLKKVEQEIAEFELRCQELKKVLAEDPGGDWERLHELANEEQAIQARLERRYAEWERLSETLARDAD